MIAEVGGGYGGGSRGLAAPLQRPCLHHTAGCSATWEGGCWREEVSEVGTACGKASERAESPSPHRRLKRPQNMLYCRIHGCDTFIFAVAC